MLAEHASDCCRSRPRPGDAAGAGFEAPAIWFLHVVGPTASRAATRSRVRVNQVRLPQGQACFVPWPRELALHARCCACLARWCRADRDPQRSHTRHPDHLSDARMDRHNCSRHPLGRRAVLGRAAAAAIPASPSRRKRLSMPAKRLRWRRHREVLQAQNFRTTAVPRGFRARLARPRQTAPEGVDASTGPATLRA